MQTEVLALVAGAFEKEEIMRIALCSLWLILTVFGCGISKTYQSDYSLGRSVPLENYRYVLVDTVSAEYPRAKNLIESLVTKQGFQPLFGNPPQLSPARLAETLRLRWAITGRKTRGVIGFSQEVSVTLADYHSGAPVYHGIGEHMGDFNEDDIRGALEAALKGLNTYKGFNEKLASVNDKAYPLKTVPPALEPSVQRQPSTATTARTKRHVVVPSYAAASSRCEKGHWIQSVSGDGSIVQLEDGSVWQVDILDRLDSTLWLPISDIIVCPGELINTDDGEKVSATQLR